MTFVTTKDEVQIFYKDWGPKDAQPLVFHHGTPGAATPIRALERGAHDRGLRYVTFSRPGYGSSSRRRGRRVVDVVSDTAEVLKD